MTFSIVTICLNAERYLAEAMDSVLSQDWQDLEYLLVDGGSGDRSWEIIQGFAEPISVKFHYFVEYWHDTG